jgi:exopolyphosphatase/pppGpp-phosphohydrolase
MVKTNSATQSANLQLLTNLRLASKIISTSSEINPVAAGKFSANLLSHGVKPSVSDKEQQLLKLQNLIKN